MIPSEAMQALGNIGGVVQRFTRPARLQAGACRRPTPPGE